MRNVMGVPAFLIGDDMVVGLDRQRVLSLVDHRLVSCDQCSQKMRVPIGKGRIKVTCPKCSNKFSVDT
jgi:RNase P subunit RPR2